jgi:hypothetical protein
MTRIACRLFGHDWLRTCCGFGLNDYVRDCARCRRREWLSGGEWTETKPDGWAPPPDTPVPARPG